MTLRRGAWLAAASAAAFAAAFYLRMNAAYGPLSVSPDPRDWILLWELLRYGQIAPRVVMESAGLGAAAAVLPWLAYAWWGRSPGA